MGSHYNNNIAEAIDILLNKRLSDLHYDQTVVAEIYSEVDPEEGHYTVQYQSVILDAWSENKTKNYKVNQSVYVKVPQSDFSQKLIIEGVVDRNKELTTNQIKNLKNFKMPILPEFNYDFDDMSLVAGDFEQNPQSKTTEYFVSFDDENTKQFTQLAKKYEVIKLEATFKNNLLDFHSIGNYGLKFSFLTSDLQEEKSRKVLILDTNHFSGNFYSYDSYGTTQSIYYTVEKETLKALESITFFQEGFKQDQNVNAPIIENGKIVGYPLVTDNNLFVTNAKITFYEVVDLIKEENYLQLEALDGFIGKNLRFSAKLISQMENNINNKGYSTFWYKQVLKKENNEETKKYLLGIDWELMNETSQTSITLSSGIGLDNYKVIVQNEEGIQLAEKTFTLLPSEDFVLPTIIQTTEPGWVKLSLPMGYSGEWVVNGIFKNKASEILLTLNKDFRERSLRVECFIYNDKEENLGNVILYLSAPIPKDEIKVTFSGQEYFQYDIEGKMYVEEAKKEKIIQIGVLTGENIDKEQLTDFNFSVGNIHITSNKEDWPEDALSQFENVYVIQNAENGIWEIHYTLNPFYKNENINNTFVFKLFVNGEEHIYTHEIILNKLGDIGTNGTQDTCRITAQEAYFKEGSTKDFVLNLEVYKNNIYVKNNFDNQYNLLSLKLFNGTSNEGIDYSNNLTILQQIIVKHEDIKIEQANYIQALISVNGKTLVAYYGIPVGGKNATFDTNKKTLIKYNIEGISENKEKYPGDLSKGNYCVELETIQGMKYTVIHYINSYGNQAINLWNGSNNDDGENNSILSKSVVAGERFSNEDGSPKFSGIIVGKVQDDTNKELGIYGYENNKNNFSITNKGKAQFDVTQLNNEGIDTVGIKINELKNMVLKTQFKFLNADYLNLADIIAQIGTEIEALKTALSDEAKIREDKDIDLQTQINDLRKAAK